MVRSFPGFFYIELYIICRVQMIICIELYTYNPDTQSCAYIIIHYISLKISMMSLCKKLKFVMVKLSFNAYNGLKHQIMHHIMSKSHCAEFSAERGRIDHSCSVRGSFLVILANSYQFE